MTLSEIKDYLKIEGNEEDTLIQGLQLAGELYLYNAGAIKDNTELYKLAIKILVGHWHDNRNLIGKTDKIAFSLDSIIQQLKYSDVEYNEAVLKLINIALTLDNDPITAINKAYDIISQYLGGV